MNKDKKRRIAGVWMIAAVLTILLLVQGIPGKQKIWTDLPYTLMRFDGLSRDVAAGDAYGAMNVGPGLTLPAGEYRVKWVIEADGNNRLEITTGNGVQVSPGSIALSRDEVWGEASFKIGETAENVEICVMFEDGSWIKVADLSLYSPMYADHVFAVGFLLLAAALLYTLHVCGWLTPMRRGKLILLGLAVLIASGPALKDTIGIGHDTTFHLVRLCNLADGLKHGFPVRIGGFSYNGYGAITSVFYPDIFMIPFAAMMNFGASMQFAANTFFIAVNIASAAFMYMAAKRIFEDEWAAVCAAILYTLSIYRVSDVFTRYAFGEMTAMVFLPLFLLGLYEVVLGDKRRWPLLAVSAASIYLSHMLSTLICAASAAGFCALFVVKIVRQKRILPIIKAAGVAGLLCAFQLVPFLMYSMQGIGAQELAKNPANSAIHPAQLFLLGEGELSLDPKDMALSTFALEIGLPLLMAAALMLYAAATAEKREEKDGFGVLLVAVGGLFAVMATTLFPWNFVRVLTRGLSDYLQFPWRFLMMTAVLFALAGGYGCVRFSRGHGEQMAAAILALAALCALPTLTDETRNADYIAFGEIVSPHLSYTEYTLPGTQTRPTADRSLLTDGDVTVTAYEKRSTTVTAKIEAKTDASISLPLFGFDGYRAQVNGKEIQWTLGENNRLTVFLPAGTEGELSVWFAGKTLWRIAEGISLATLLALTCCWMRKRKAAS